MEEEEDLKPCQCVKYKEDPDTGDCCICGHWWDNHDHHRGALPPICNGLI